MASQKRSVNNLVAHQWTNPSNAFTEDNLCTYTNVDGEVNTYNFINNPFSIPLGAIIDGIEVRTKRGGYDNDDYYMIKLKDKNGVIREKTGTAQIADGGVCSGCKHETLGSPTDLWGGTWTATHINSTNFRLLLYYLKTGKANYFYVDHIEVTVYYTTATGWKKLQYVTEPPSPSWNKIKFASEPPVAGAWNKVLYEGE